MPIEGDLKELGLPSIIQLNCTERNTARVSVSHQGREGMICFEGGSVVHATAGDLVGEEAVYELLAWPEGSFIVETDLSPPKRTISAEWNMLLLEGMRRIDEGTPAAVPPAADDITALAQDLKKIAGVEGAVIASRDGVVLGSDTESDAEREGAVAVFLGNAAGQVGQALDLTPFDWGVVTMGKDRVLILERPDIFVGLLLAQKSSPALTSAEAAKLLG
jgi:predicted regulator of Ras-like GTPase activity (Roadblock/LC7/MglB family)